MKKTGKPEPQFSWDEIEALQKTVRSGRPGPEWFTRREYQERFKLGRWMAQSQLNRLWNQGLVERRATSRTMTYYRRATKGG